MSDFGNSCSCRDEVTMTGCTVQVSARLVFSHSSESQKEVRKTRYWQSIALYGIKQIIIVAFYMLTQLLIIFC